MGKCEQAEFTQGNLVLEILPIIIRFSELHEKFFFSIKHIKGLRKTYPRRGMGKTEEGPGVIQQRKTDEAPVGMKVTMS